LRVQAVTNRRLSWFVVCREGTVLHAHGCEEPPFAIGLHDKRIISGQCIWTEDALLGLGSWCTVDGEVRGVIAHPLGFVFIPPDELLALRPRFALGICRGSVIENPTVCRPSPGPFIGHFVLFVAWHP